MAGDGWTPTHNFYGDDFGMVSIWVYYDQNDDHVNGDWWEV